ncbi:hypothetical protein NIA71_04615 [Ihubacter massiliensis]|uniref:Uncharacterized protein n=1 Tax=Hominibacterium faecale TaxID=2839743 RepID=A0A9J6QTU8_9FIRM|nr:MULTISPECIES: hypothetical protein [Eubacteriales Family XIII. Incertae Sedis]MCO7121233.1 hypothetical protein [Ihubacter massiliensis]MCU7378219.1 hypothetical protein [Hominibacterium faecale]
MDKQMFASMIVKYWYLVEFLGQPNFPAQSKKGRKLCQEAADGNISYKQLTVYHTLPGKVLRLQKRTENLPSDPGAALKQDMRTYYSYGVISDEINLCLGKMERYVLAERLKQAFRPDLELPEKNHSPVCLIGMKCDKQGRYIPGSINISPLAWGVNQLLAHADELTEENIADFLSIDMYQLNMNQWDNQLVELEDEAKVGKILTSSLLTSITKSIERKYLSYVIQPGQEMNWEGVLIYRRYRTEEIKAQDADVFHYSDLYNSFFANDLNMVEQAISYGKMDQNPLGNAIFDYITGVYAEENPNLHWMNLQERIDVQRTWEKGKKQEQADFFHHHLDIDKAPLGKWPSRFMPCLMQQLAINLSWKPSSENLPIFSVNGPPGTGKTTLLKEIIAGNVVERACMLAKYEDPDEAFVQKCFQDGDKPHCGYSKFYWGYYDFNDEQLKDYGMLVASSNNAAVENITKELPDRNCVAKRDTA